MANVVFYCESAGCGGHETMALLASQAILRHHPSIALSWIVPDSNPRLAAALGKAAIPFTALDLRPPFRFLRNPLPVLRKALRTRRILRRLRPGLVVLVQGGITDGFDGLLAARWSGVPACSYIPLAQNSSQLALRRMPRLRDRLIAPSFKSIPRYITIDEQQASNLRRWNPRASVATVENYLPGIPPPARRAAEAKQALGLAPHLTVLGVIGRIQFAWKAQDWLLAALADGGFFRDKALLCVGDGPDSPQLAALIESSPWKSQIRRLPWTGDLDPLYDAMDLLVIPSRAEGVPQVMLEALARRIPVVASDRDGMKTWLPPQWRFPFGDAQAMKSCIASALLPLDAESWTRIDQRLDFARDQQRFGLQFGDALLRYASPASLPPAANSTRP
ncbi:MAG: glycosyltransferase [Acidobacteriaceae bacterium]